MAARLVAVQCPTRPRSPRDMDPCSSPVTPTLPTQPADEQPSVHLDVRGLDDRSPTDDLAIDARPEFGRTVADRLHQLRGKLFADRCRPDCFYHLALNLRNDSLWRVRRRDHAHPGV